MLQPVAASKIRLIVIKASEYSDLYRVKFVPDGAGAGGPQMRLTEPQIIVGASAAAVVGDANLQRLEVELDATVPADKKITIDAYVVRMA